MKSKTKEPIIADANAKFDILNKIPAEAKIKLFDLAWSKTASLLKIAAAKWKGMSAADHLQVGAIVLIGAEMLYQILAASNTNVARVEGA